jgi:hypothetical protein
VVEEAALAWLGDAGWQIAHGSDIAPGMPAAERRDHDDAMLAKRVRDTLMRLNPALPADAANDAFRKLTRPEGAEQEKSDADGAGAGRAAVGGMGDDVTSDARQCGHSPGTFRKASRDGRVRFNQPPSTSLDGGYLLIPRCR